MQRQGLVDRPARTVVDAVALTGGLQAQELAAARLGVRARSSTSTMRDVQHALDEDRSVVRTWLMRNTIHLVPASDVRWLVALFGPMIRRRFERRWMSLGLSPAVLTQATRAAPDALADGPLTRHELVAALGARGVAIAPTGQAPVHLMLHLATLGLTCHANGARFALLDEWVPDAPLGPRGDGALAELARRYFRAFSPATGADFTAWSGLPSRAAIALIRDELSPVGSGFTLGETPARGGVRLLGAFDNYLLGYRDRDRVIAAAHRAEVYVGGVIRPTIVHDGRVIGRWRIVRPASDDAPLSVEVRYFNRPSAAVRAAVGAEVDDIGRFLGRPATTAPLAA